MKKNDEIKIDKGIPLPAPRAPRSRMIPCGLEKLAPDESFFIAGRSASDVSGHISYAKMKLKRLFVTRTRIEKGIRGVRVWRVPDEKGAT